MNEYEKQLTDSGDVSQQLLDQGKEATKNWTKEDWEDFHKESDDINKALVILIQKNSDATDLDVQEIIQRHYNWVKRCWTPNRESYIALSELYGKHNDFRVYYEGYHPDMIKFLSLAMKIFAEKIK